MMSEIGTDSYIVAGVDDHIVPWQVSYRTTQLFKGPMRFVMTSGGHIAGIVSPPGPKVRLWTNDELPRDADAWRAGAAEHRDTWWNDWSALAGRARRRAPRRRTGDRQRPAPADRGGAGRVREELSSRRLGRVGLDVAAVDREQRLLLVVGEAVVGPDGALGVAAGSASSASSSTPACVSSVSAERLSARAIDWSTRTEGSWRPRSSWLRYGLETCARSAIWRSDRLASWRWARMNAPSAWSWSSRSVVIAVGRGHAATPGPVGGYRTGSPARAGRLEPVAQAVAFLAGVTRRRP